MNFLSLSAPSSSLLDVMGSRLIVVVVTPSGATTVTNDEEYPIPSFENLNPYFLNFSIKKEQHHPGLYL
jgi:hypothetical protein